MMQHSFGKIPLVDLQAQYQLLRREIDQAIAEVIGAGQFIGGEPVLQFAKDFARKINTAYCIPCANGTDSIEIALATLGIGNGDEVILPAFSFVATVEAVVNAGATPVLCDIDPVTYTIDTKQAISLVSSRTKAFMPVHLYGQVADLNPLVAFAQDHHMYVIEDAAQAHGATYDGQLAGSIGDINSFSFYPGKNLGAYGDAGALTTNSEWLATKAKKIANHGRIEKYDHDIIGRNSRMDSIQAAVLAVKLRYLDKWIEARRSHARYYNAVLQDIEALTVPAIIRQRESVFHLYVIRMPAGRRDACRQFLADKGIETGIHYPIALSQLKAVTAQLRIHASCPEAEKASSEVLSLPLYPELTTDMIDYISAQLHSFFKNG